MLAVLGPVALHSLPESVITRDGEGQPQHMVAGLDDPQDATHSVLLLLLPLTGLEALHQLVLHDDGAAVKALHHLEEVDVFLVVGRRLVVVSLQVRPEPWLWGGGRGGLPTGAQAQQRGRVCELPSLRLPTPGLRARRRTAGVFHLGSGTWRWGGGRGGEKLLQAWGMTDGGRKDLALSALLRPLMPFREDVITRTLSSLYNVSFN